MRVALRTSVSSRISTLASLTVPNKFRYCMRHGYSLLIDNTPYDQAVKMLKGLLSVLDEYDLLWCMDCDAVITNMAPRIEELECLGPHVTVCEEGIVSWNRLNCGSMVWRNTARTRELICEVADSYEEWRGLPCIWQTWLQDNLSRLGDTVTVAPLRSFNSCVWNKPAGADGEPGSHWHAGDFVCHPCGVFPMDERERYLADVLGGMQ